MSHDFQSEKSTSEIGVKVLVFFTFFVNFFIKTLIKSTIYCQAVSCASGAFTYVCCENCMPGFSAFVLNFSKSGNIFFRLMANGNCLVCSHQLSLVQLGDNSLVHMNLE